MAHERGIGATLDRLGGGGPGEGQEPLPGPWRVVALSDGRFRGTSAMLHAPETAMGPTALLAQGGVEVLTASIRQQPLHREAFTHIGVDLASRSIVGVKSSAHFRAAFQEIASRVIVCLAPGENREDPSDFPYARLRPGVRLRPRR
ncbi:MAG: MlrC C-terminal domain-containing protein [Rhizobiales bacterium]|nr:MlrC C-terminal domain-containing protein [Hyphomicrobiales bacterium]